MKLNSVAKLLLLTIPTLIIVKIANYYMQEQFFRYDYYGWKNAYPNFIKNADKYKENSIILGDSTSEYLDAEYLSKKTNTKFYNMSSSVSNYIDDYFLLKRIINKNIKIKMVYLQIYRNLGNNFNVNFSKLNLLSVLNKKEFYSLNQDFPEAIKIYHEYNDIFGEKKINVSVKELLLSQLNYLLHKKEVDKTCINELYGTRYNVLGPKSIEEKKFLKDLQLKHRNYNVDKIFKKYFYKTIKLLEENNIPYKVFNQHIITNVISDKKAYTIEINKYVKDNLNIDAKNTNINYCNTYDYFLRQNAVDASHLQKKYHKDYTYWFLENIVNKSCKPIHTQKGKKDE